MRLLFYRSFTRVSPPLSLDRNSHPGDCRLIETTSFKPFFQQDTPSQLAAAAASQGLQGAWETEREGGED